MWALSDQALVSGANFFTNILLARALQPSGFGVFALCWATVLLMSTLEGAAVVMPMMSIGPKQQPEAQPAYYGAVATQAFCLGLLCAAAVYCGALGLSGFFPRWHLRVLAAPLTMATAGYVLQDWWRRYFFTIGEGHLAMCSDALSYLGQLPLLWWLAQRGELTLPLALWIIGLTSVLSVIASVLWRAPMQFQFRSVASVARRHWAMVRWLAPSALLQWASLNLFTISAPVYYGAAAAGALRASQNIVAIAHVWFLGLDNVLPAEAARRLHAKGISAALRYLREITVRWGLVTLGFMGVVSLFPVFWLHLLYGVQYVHYAGVLRLYSLLYLITFFGGPLRAGLQAIEFTAPLLWSYILMTLFAAVMAAPLARALGLSGVMLGLMATQLLFQGILAAALITRSTRMRKEQIQLQGELLAGKT